MPEGLKKVLSCLLSGIFLWVVTGSPAMAHRMLIYPVAEGEIRVAYEDGRFSRRTEVVVYDRDHKELARGKLDGQGHFCYAGYPGAALIVADDGLGHRVEWKVGEEVPVGPPRVVTVSLVLLGLALVAAVFHYRTRTRAG